MEEITLPEAEYLIAQDLPGVSALMRNIGNPALDALNIARKQQSANISALLSSQKSILDSLNIVRSLDDDKDSATGNDGSGDSDDRDLSDSIVDR